MTNELQPLAALCMDGCFADNPVIDFLHFADAAFYRNRGADCPRHEGCVTKAAIQSMSLAPIQIVLSWRLLVF
ncbi:hypothetical protein N9R76_05255 [Planktomarina temperata]|nr:hypothetical protein [Planktomarina temperata]